MEKAAKVDLPSDSLSQVLFSNNSDALLLLSSAGDILNANYQAHKIYAYEQDELSGKNISEICLSPLINFSEGVVYPEPGSQLSAMHRRKDGSEFTAKIEIFKTELEPQPFFLAIIRSSNSDYNFRDWEINQQVENLKVFSNRINEVFFIYDRDSRISYMNPRFIDKMGYSPDEVIGKKLLNFIPPEYHSSVQKEIQDRLIKGVQNTFYTGVKFKDSSQIIIRVKSSPIIEHGIITGGMCLAEDMTEKMQQEEAIRKSEANLQSLFNTMQEGFVVWEIIYNENQQLIDLKFVDLNPTFEKHIRIPRSQLIGKRITEQKLFIEDYWFTVFNKVLETGQPQDFEGYFSHFDSYFELFIFQPEPSHIACLVVDISARCRAEKDLANEKEWLAVTLESIAEGVIATDTSGRVIFLNQVAAEMLGWTQDNAVGKQLSDLLNEVDNMYVLKENGDDSIDLIEGHTVELYDNMVCIVRDGKRRILSNSAATIRDKEGNDLGMVMVLGDITEKKKIEEKIQYLSYNDKLTGLYNRAFIDTILSDLDQEEQLPVSLIMGDINGLKLTNDVFGHQEGDKLLVNVASILKKSCRDSDIVARWGGDEFLLILPRTDNEVAIKVCERIRKACKQTGTDPITMSIALGTATRVNMQQAISEVFISAEEQMYSNKLSESRIVRSEIIAGLEKTLCARSCENEEHSSRMKDMALKIAQSLNLDKSEMDELALLASLHDIGNVAIPQEILMKVEPLDEDDWDKIKKHPETGYRMAQSIPELRPIAEAILAHHEYWDGSGYPQGLSGTEIPMLARIISVIDAYDVMTHDCVYKKAVSPKQALAELRKCSGSQFDPQIVDVLIKVTAYTTF